jgi:hypothetical protein
MRSPLGGSLFNGKSSVCHHYPLTRNIPAALNTAIQYITHNSMEYTNLQKYSGWDDEHGE